VSTLVIGLLGVVLAATPPAAVSTQPTKSAPATISSPNPEDPVEREYLKLLEEDDRAQAEADEWIREHRAKEAAGEKVQNALLSAKIDQRFEVVRKGYRNFIQKHPKHTRSRLAFGSFLNDIGEEEEAANQWEKALEIEPDNPATLNNLANHYGHRGPVEKAFAYYERALQLQPEEPVYLQNLAVTTYLFRKDAMAFYKISEPEVFDRSLALYRKALKLDPQNFPLATDYAQSFYGIRPLRVEEALQAWDEALKVANDEIERQGVYLHIARVSLNSGRFEQARQHLEKVQDPMYDVLKSRLVRNLEEKEKAASEETKKDL
jgi:tetratricopeptide (TPR) repeat protein